MDGASVDSVPQGEVNFTEPYQPLTLEMYGAVVHQSAWPDIMAKAKRLIMSGQVTVVHNSPTRVLGHVIGDHGEYDNEITRTDPNSPIIEQWSCECPWDQYAFNRTLRWKKFEGRVCSHVLALYWKAKSTPLDTSGMDQGYTAPRGQMMQGQPPSGTPAPWMNPPQGERSFGPENATQPMQGPSEAERYDALRQMRQKVKDRIRDNKDYLPDVGENLEMDFPNMPRAQDQEPPPGLPSTRQLGIGPQPQPGTQFNVPRQPAPQYQQMHLFDVTQIPQVPPNPQSFPGGSQNGTMGLPGTFSHIEFKVVKGSELHYSDDGIADWLATMRANGRIPIVAIRHKGIMLPTTGGKIPRPGAEPASYYDDGRPHYRRDDLGFDPETGTRINADERPGGAPGLEGMDPEKWQIEGAWAEAKQGARAEVIDTEPITKMAFIHVALQEGSYLEPRGLKGWVSYDDLVALPDAPSPFVRRR